MVAIPEKQQIGIQLSSLEWIVGKWYGENSQNIMEEDWHPIMGDAMAGWFRWKKENSIFLYEFMLFQQVDNIVVLKIKHFDSNLVGWEEKDKWVEYVAWNSALNEIILKASDPKHTPWIAYERIGSKLTASFYDISGNQTDKYEFHS
ncbi:MAG: DUF6265 family protein [Promethearchaeota archaeon]